MRWMKRLQLPVLFVIAIALLTPTPALAAKSRSTNLTCVVVDPADPDYGASGIAKLTVAATYWDTFYGFWVQGDLSVSCRGLTPGVSYSVFGFYDGARAITPKQNGNGSVKGGVGFWNTLEVWVVRQDGKVVLEGTIY